MSTWYIVLALAALLAIGAVRQYLFLQSLIKRLELMKEFLNKFIEWCNGGGQDQAIYNWLLSKSEVVQIELGTTGLTHYRRPFENAYLTNVPIILNFIPEILKIFHNGMLSFSSFSQESQIFHIQAVDECLRRHIGSREELLENERKRLFNPLVWFGGGIAWLMELPLTILSEAGGISSELRGRIVRGKVFSFFSGIAAVATFFAAIVAIVIGWDKFISIISQWMK